MATNTELEEQNAELLARLDQLLEQNMELSNQVANLTKMLFGSRSEKRAILRKRFLRTKRLYLMSHPIFSANQKRKKVKLAV